MFGYYGSLPLSECNTSLRRKIDFTANRAKINSVAARNLGAVIVPQVRIASTM
jgi:hypothetical protein